MRIELRPIESVRRASRLGLELQGLAQAVGRRSRPYRGCERHGRADVAVAWRVGERAAQDRHAGLAVHQRVVDLVVDREAVPGQPLDDVHLPAGAMPLEDRRVQVGDQLVQLLVGTGRGQGEVQHVVRGVDALDLLPQRHAGLPEHGDAVERRQGLRGAIGRHDLANDLAAAARTLEDEHRAHVPRVVHGLREEEHQVEHRDRRGHGHLPQVPAVPVQAARRSSAVSSEAFRPPAYFVSPTLS